jgi:hypothetical protein
MWYDVAMNMSKFDFRVKFDAHREVFVMMVKPVHYDGLVARGEKSYEAYALSVFPHTFRVCIPVDEIPDGFFAIGAEMPHGVRLDGLRFVNSNACFTFEFADEELLLATPTIYRSWIATLIKEGYILDAFARE